MSAGWPDNFDFRNDDVCRRIFQPFIQKQMNALKAYDAKRPFDSTYIFHEHAQRVARDAEALCMRLNLREITAYNMYWALLPHDIGKTRLPVDLWDTEGKPDEALKKLRRSHTTLGVEIVQEELPDIDHPFKDLMTDIMRLHHEQMDGGGYLGIKGEELSLPVRLAALVEAFDGWSIPRPHFEGRNVSPAAVLTRMRTEKAGMFDPTLFEAFAEMKMSRYKKAL